MMDRVSTNIVGLDGLGNVERFADYLQSESWQRAQEAKNVNATAGSGTESSRPAAVTRKLSYLEAREYATLEDRIAEAEQTLEAKQTALQDPAIASDGPRLLAISTEIEAAQKAVDQLYARWAELEEKQSSGSF